MEVPESPVRPVKLVAYRYSIYNVQYKPLRDCGARRHVSGPNPKIYLTKLVCMAANDNETPLWGSMVDGEEIPSSQY